MGQEKGVYYDYKSAFSDRNNVKSIHIQCAYDNLRPTDGCDAIPDSIDYFKNLEFLSITETRVKSLPGSINRLKKLKTIRLGLNTGFDYNEQLCKLSGIDSLETLGLWWTNFKILPGCIVAIKTLRRVEIRFNHELNLKKAFHTLSLLPGLSSLDISGIKSKVIPRSIKLLKGLTTIELGYLRKINLRKCLTRLSVLNIEYLNLENDGIMRLPPQIGLLKTVVYLNLGDNYLTELPVEIYQLKNLRVINIYKSEISDQQKNELAEKLPNCKIISEPHFYIR